VSSKYEAGDTRLVADDVVLTDHAIERWRQRTPHDCSLDPRIAWDRGEDIKHPEVCQSDGESDPPERVRVYRHGNEWGVAFLIAESQRQDGLPSSVPNVVVTVVDLGGFDHGPTRAYLHSHGPHGGVADE
jgi:hypothetical protein